MAANVNVIAHASIRKNGGPISEDRYKDDGSNSLKKGQWCYVSGGTVVPVDTGAEVLTTADAAFAAAHKFVICLEDHTAASSYVPVQEITVDTQFEGYVVDSEETGDVAMDSTDIGLLYRGYQDSNLRMAVDNTATAGIFYIQDVDTVYDPYRQGGDYEEDAGGVRHTRVLFKINPSLVL
jgi:hypothetical protein